MVMPDAMGDDYLAKVAFQGKLVMCGSGHRLDKLGGYQQCVYKRLVTFAKTVLLEQKPDVLISGMALGWDQALAAAASKLSIPWVAAVPFLGQESNWPLAARVRYFDLLEKAWFSLIISNGVYAVKKMQIRNVWMVDRSQKLLLLWNGTPGGTHNCLKYAIEKGVPWINYWKAWDASSAMT